MIANSKVRHQIRSREEMVQAQKRKEEQRTKLAEYAHAAWSGWMKYQVSKAVVNEDGSWTIPAASAERWQRQMNTEFKDLPSGEEASDFAEADKILAIVGA